MIQRTAGAFGDYNLDDISILAMQAKKDRNVISQLWSKVYRLVVGTCNNFWKVNTEAKRRCELDDLIQESYLFFEEAIEKYEPDRGMKFSSYLMFYIKKACRSAIRCLTQKQQNDPIFQCESLDAPIQKGEDITIGEMVSDENSEKCYDDIDSSDAVILILEQVKKINGGMNKYCFLEYAYYNRPVSDIARSAHISQTAIIHHIHNAADQLRNNPIIKATYPERYERSRYFISEYQHKGLGAFLTTGSSVVEDIVNRRNLVNWRFDKDVIMEDIWHDRN